MAVNTKDDKFGFNKAKQLEYLSQWKRKNLLKQHTPPPKKWSNQTTRKFIYGFMLMTFVCVQLSMNLPKLRNLGRLQCSKSFDIGCIERLWNGDPLEDLPTNSKFEVSLVISSCGEDMKSYMDYINNVKNANVIVKSTTVITECSPPSTLHKLPNYVTTIKSDSSHPQIHFLEWVRKQFGTSSQETPHYYHHKNTFILFLNRNWVDDEDINVRILDDVLQASLETGFGCVQQPVDGMSYYHDGAVLSQYTALEPAKEYDDFGAWLDHLNITSAILKELVPVCYGSSFAVQSRDLLKHESLNSLVTSMLSDYRSNEENEGEIPAFIERSLASMFTRHKLSKLRLGKLKRYTSDIYTHETYTGAFLHDFKHSPLYKFFLGDTLEDNKVPENLRLSLVVSHCDEDMAWMKGFISGYEMQNVTIYSNCNSTINGYSPPGSKVIELPDGYGRCDHSYAHWMANMEEEDATEDHLVLFLKANRRSDNNYEGMRYRYLTEIIRIALANGFSCGLENDQFYYHNTAKLKTFKTMTGHQGSVVNSSHYDTMGEYLDEIGVKLPTPINPVCYGGNFAVMASQIYPKRVTLKRMEESLKNGDNNDFAERIWAGLLSYPLSTNQVNALRSIPTVVSNVKEGFVGHLRMKV